MNPAVRTSNEDPAGCLYAQVAAMVNQLIDAGTLRPGERVPSVRRLARLQEVSISTVLQAYRHLEDRGLIEARPQSGYYVRTRQWRGAAEPELRRPEPKATHVTVSDLVMEVVKAIRDPSLIRLGATMPAPELFPTAELNRTMGAIGRRNPARGNSYEPAPGSLALRTQVARRAMDCGCVLSPDDIVVTCGATEALSLCLRAVAQPGDTIAIESPTFFGFLQMIESLGLRTCEVPTHPRDGVLLEELERRLDWCGVKACLFALNFSNPLGCLMPDSTKEKLVAMLARRGIPLIEDDIYGSLSFGAERPKTAKAYDRNGLVLLCDSFTKTLAPGYRVGWTAPGRYRARVEYLKFVSTSATATLPQLAIAEFLASGGFDHHLRKIRRFYALQSQRMTDLITRSFPAGTRLSRPQGGMVLWVELAGDAKAMELYERAMAEKISIAPGPLFSPEGRYENCIRINCSNPWSAALESAVTRLGEISAELAG